MKKDSVRDDKIADALLGITFPQFQWLQEVGATKHLTEDEASHLLITAHMAGLRRTVSLLVLRRKNERLGFPVSDTDILNKAHGAYGNPNSKDA